MSIRKITVPNRQYREFKMTVGAPNRAVAAADGGGEASAAPARAAYPLSFSSEEPVYRYDWWNDLEYYEVLSHDPADINLSRSEPDGIFPFLRSHDRREMVGSVRNPAVNKANRTMEGDGYFSSIEDGQRAQTLVDEGDLRTVSVGYSIESLTLLKAADKTNPIPTYIAKWQPIEISLEPVAADVTVGIGRTKEALRANEGLRRAAEALGTTCFEVEVPEDPQPEGERDMSIPAGVAPTNGAAPAPAAAEPTTALGRDYAAELRQLNVLAAQCDGRVEDGMTATERANKWSEAGLTPDQAAGEAFRAMTAKATQGARAAQAPELPANTRKLYKMGRAFRMLVEVGDNSRQRFDGFEGEIHQELARHSPLGTKGGIKIPLQIPRSEEEQDTYDRWKADIEIRTLGTDQAAGGQTLIPTALMDLIDVLRNKARVLQFGAQLYGNLVGSIPWPRQLTAANVNWMGENPVSPVTAGEPTFDSVVGSPKTLIGQTVVSRQLLTMSNFSLETKLKNDLAIGHGLAIDLAALNGSGSANQPRGILNTVGVSSVDFNGPPTHELNTAMATELAIKNALISGSLGFLTEPKVAGYEMSHLVAPGVPGFMWSGTHDNGVVAGYRAASTNQVPNNLGVNSDLQAKIFADWSQAVVLMWGNEMELVVDPLTRAGYGQLVITSFSMADFILQRLFSFCIANGLKAA